MNWGLGASAIKLNSILGHISLGSMKFPSRVLGGKIGRFVAAKGLHKPLDEKEWCYGSASDASIREFCKLDFENVSRMFVEWDSECA